MRGAHQLRFTRGSIYTAVERREPGYGERVAVSGRDGDTRAKMACGNGRNGIARSALIRSGTRSPKKRVTRAADTRTH